MIITKPIGEEKCLLKKESFSLRRVVNEKLIKIEACQYDTRFVPIFLGFHFKKKPFNRRIFSCKIKDLSTFTTECDGERQRKWSSAPGNTPKLYSLSVSHRHHHHRRHSLRYMGAITVFHRLCIQFNCNLTK